MLQFVIEAGAGWSQVWGYRRGFGFVPYFRYVTGGGASAMYFAEEDVPSEDDRTSGFDICWGADLADYIGRTRLEDSQRDALRAVVEAVRAMQPTIVGWMEDEPGRHVWSTGDAAKQTILAAVEDLRKQDLFWAPAGQAVEVYAPSR